MEQYNIEATPASEGFTKYNTGSKNSLYFSKLSGGYASNINNIGIDSGKEIDYGVNRDNENEKHFPLVSISNKISPTTHKHRTYNELSSHQLDKNNLYTDSSRYSFEPPRLENSSKVRSERNSIQKTLDYWIGQTKFTLALPVVSAAGLDLLTKNRKLTLTRKVLGSYGKAIKWTVSNSPKAYHKAKTVVDRLRK